MGLQIIGETDTISKGDCYNQIMYELQKRMVDIDTNREQKKPIYSEVADMVLLINKLSEIEGVDNKIIDQRKTIIENIMK